MNFNYATCALSYPAASEPRWAAQVERWYQLDAPAYSLCEGYVELGLEREPRPSIIFLASPGGSSFTDSQFALSGAQSPAKFVHTLPNIRASVLLQLMQWNGPLLCFQNDPSSLRSALQQVTFFSQVWIVGYRPEGEVYFLMFQNQGEFALRAGAEQGERVSSDAEIFSWLRQPKGELALDAGWSLVRRVS